MTCSAVKRIEYIDAHCTAMNGTATSYNLMEHEGASRRAETRRMPQMPEEPRPRRPRVVLKAGEIARKLRSFDHFAYLYGQRAGYFLPPKHALAWACVAQILSEEKLLLKASDVGPPLILPKSRGLHIEISWARYKDAHDLHRYFPDTIDSGRIPRDYFFNV